MLGAKRKGGKRASTEKRSKVPKVTQVFGPSEDAGLPNLCPECDIPFKSGVGTDPLLEICGHFKCKNCFVSNFCRQNDLCPQCSPDWVENSAAYKLKLKRLSSKKSSTSGRRKSGSRKVSNNIRPAAAPRVTIKLEHEPSSDSADSEEKVEFGGGRRGPKFIHALPSHVIKVETRRDKDGNSRTTYECTVCKKRFTTRAHCRYHEFCATKVEKPFKCEECGRDFISKSHFEYHTRTHKGERPFKCPVCGKGFLQQGKVTRHMRVHSGENPFVCPTCTRAFRSKDALHSHIRGSHTGERPFFCRHCDMKFSCKSTKAKHEAKVHPKGSVLQCEICGKPCANLDSFNTHMRMHSPGRKYSCEQCSKSFTYFKDLRRHEVIHTGARPFVCVICNVDFRRKDNLLRHIHKSHHRSKEETKRLGKEAEEAALRRLAEIAVKMEDAEDDESEEKIKRETSSESSAEESDAENEENAGYSQASADKDPLSPESLSDEDVKEQIVPTSATKTVDSGATESDSEAVPPTVLRNEVGEEALQFSWEEVEPFLPKGKCGSVNLVVKTDTGE